MLLVPHGYYFGELGLAVFNDIDALSYLVPALVLVLCFQVHLPTAVHVVQDGANFGETR
jgi:hypothetical protein